MAECASAFHVPEASLRAQIGAVLGAWGFGPDAVAAGTDGLAYADLRGIHSHGIAMLPIYERWRSEGRFVAGASPSVVQENAVSALIDGGSGLGFLPATVAMRLAIAKAMTAGVSAVSVRRSNHFGAAGHYAVMAAQDGLIGLALSNTVAPAIVPTGGREARFGTNPIAFAAPAARSEPFVLDMATSTVALGKLMMAAYRDETIPLGWALDATGRPTTDATAGYASRLATPLGALPELSSHKGSGLAAMVEILSAVVSGATPAMDTTPGQPGDVGHFFLALDPAIFRCRDEYGAALDRLMEKVRATEPAEPGLPVQVAGDPEREALRHSRTGGICLPAALIRELEPLVARAGCEWHLPDHSGDPRHQGIS